MKKQKQYYFLSIILLLNGFLAAQSISGFIREDATGEPLSYANIMLKGTGLGTASRQDGYFVITNVPAGQYEILASMIGYEMGRKSITILANENVRIQFRLKMSVIEGEEVNVSAERIKFEKMVEPSQVTLDVRQIEVVPSFLEPDVFRTLQLLPGVKTLNDFSSALYVRGSTPDQNLILLDGITVYNPFHLGGVFSTFNTDAIKEAQFHAGGFPARYGGRMGSILNIINREGNTEEFKGKANISMISSKGIIEGPLPKWSKVNGSWMLAGRRTYFDIFTGIATAIAKKNYPDEMDGAPDNFFPYHFYDVEGKLNFDINDNHRLTFSTFYGDDIFDMDFSSINNWEGYGEDTEINHSKNSGNFEWRWGNRTNSLTWRWIVNPNLIAKTFLAESRFRIGVDIDEVQEGYNYTKTDTSIWRNEFHFDVFDMVKDKTIESELTWLTGKNHIISGGFQHKQLDFNLGMIFEIGIIVDSTNKFTTFQDTVLWMQDTPFEQAIFIQDKWEISPVLSAQLGFRLSRYSHQNKLYSDPRFGLKYFLTSNTSLKMNWGRYHQFLTIANPQDENLRFIDIWLALPKDYPAPYSDHVILGVEHMTDDNMLYRVEAYYKDFENMITLKQGKMFEEGDEFMFSLTNEFWKTDAYAYGLEFLLQKTTGKVTGWLGYTFSETKWKTELHHWYHPKYDRTHTIDAVWDWQWTDITHVGMTMSYSTGNPYTPVIGRGQNWVEDKYSGFGDNIWMNSSYIVGDKNSERHPSYFRWDVSFVRRKPTKSGGHKEWYFQIINVTNHLNTLLYTYEQDWDEKTESSKGVKRLGIPMFPFFPTFGYRIEF